MACPGIARSDTPSCPASVVVSAVARTCEGFGEQLSRGDEIKLPALLLVVVCLQVDTTAAFVKCKLAYEILADRQRRQQYDKEYLHTSTQQVRVECQQQPGTLLPVLCIAWHCPRKPVSHTQNAGILLAVS